MNAYHYQTKRDRSYFEWGGNMQIIRKGKGEIAMTESELVDFFGVTWRKLNYRLQLLLKISPLQPDERNVGEVEVFVNGQLKGYAPLYPLTIIKQSQSRHRRHRYPIGLFAVGVLPQDKGAHQHCTQRLPTHLSPQARGRNADFFLGITQ